MQTDGRWHRRSCQVQRQQGCGAWCTRPPADNRSAACTWHGDAWRKRAATAAASGVEWEQKPNTGKQRLPARKQAALGTGRGNQPCAAMAMACAQHMIGGCNVSFPHQPYGVQFVYMGALIRALNAEGNALLEAPTGSGKTLSLLCSALAWQQRRKREIAEMHTRRQVEHAEANRQQQGQHATDATTDVPCKLPKGDKDVSVPQIEIPKLPRIFFATRTHSQIAQVGLLDHRGFASCLYWSHAWAAAHVH
eukprot:353839-Chlamydomonas_euryale.AAC.25